MRLFGKLGILFVGMVILLAGCSDDNLKTQTLAGITRAQQELQAAKEQGVDQLAAQEFQSSEVKLGEAESLHEGGKYAETKIALEEFELLLQNAQLVANEARQAAELKAKEEATARSVALSEAEKKRREEEEMRNAKAEAHKLKVLMTYKIAKGDTLWDIAGSIYKDNFKWPYIFEANKKVIKNPELIYPQQKLKILKLN